MPADEAKTHRKLNWGDCPGVRRDPGRLSGAWTFGDTRLPIQTVFTNLAGGTTILEITEQFSVTEEQVRQVLRHAARMLEEDVITSEDTGENTPGSQHSAGTAP